MLKMTGSNIDFLGTYGVCFEGFVTAPSGLIPLVAVGWMHANGQGQLTVKRTIFMDETLNYEPLQVISGTYHVAQNGTGTADLVIPKPGGGDPNRELYSFVINSDNSEVQFIGTGIKSPDGISVLPSMVIRGVGRKQ